MLTEKTRLKREAKQIRKEIAKARALIRQRQQVKSMRGQLDDLQYQILHPDWDGGPIA